MRCTKCKVGYKAALNKENTCPLCGHREMPPTKDEDLFTMADARSKRDKGIQQSSDRSGDEWKAEAINFVRSFLYQNATLFVDDLWKAGLSRPSSPRALGAVMQHARKEGWMKDQTVDGCILARQSKASNMQLKRVWRSLIYLSEQKGEQ